MRRQGLLYAANTGKVGEDVWSNVATLWFARSPCNAAYDRTVPCPRRDAHYAQCAFQDCALVKRPGPWKNLLKFALRLSRALACPIESIGVPTRRPAHVGPMLWVRRSRHVVTVRPAYALFTPKFSRERNVCCHHFCCFPIVPACNALEGWKHTGTALDNRNA